MKQYIKILKNPLIRIALSTMLVMLCVAAGRGQQYKQTNGEYHIEQYQVPFGSHFSTSDPTTDLTMECLAANGYGQWTSTSSPGSLGINSQTSWVINHSTNYNMGAGWYLVGNMLS